MVKISGNLDDALAIFTKQVESISSGLTDADRRAINLQGAQVFEKAERDETNAKHRSTHHDTTFGHAADNVGMCQPKGIADDSDTSIGAYVVGWKNHYHAMNMMRVNDGTINIIGDHFITNLRQNETVRQRILEAEKAEYDRIVAKKGDAANASR